MCGRVDCGKVLVLIFNRNDKLQSVIIDEFG